MVGARGEWFSMDGTEFLEMQLNVLSLAMLVGLASA